MRLKRHDADGPTEPRRGPRQGSVLAGAVAERKHVAIHDETGGWRASEKLLHQLSSEMKWTQSPRIFAKKNSEIMPILRGLEDTLVIIPYQEGTSQIYGVIDHLVDIPLLISPAYLVRTQGKPLKDKPWLVARVGNTEKAQMWRLFFWKLFKAESRKEDMMREMLRLWPQEVRIPEAREWPVWDLAERL